MIDEINHQPLDKQPPTRNKFMQMLIRAAAKMRTRDEGGAANFSDLRSKLTNNKDIVEHSTFISAIDKEILNPNLDVFALSQGIFESLKDNFNIPGLSLVIMGSNVHGGAELRKIVKSAESPDFDYTLTSNDNTILENNLGSIKEFIKVFVRDHSKEFGLPDDFEVCEYYDARRTIQNIKNPDEANRIIFDSMSKDKDKDTSSILLYFYPSVPPEINHKNQQYLLEELRNIHKTQPDYWEKISLELISKWKKFHQLKYKHFGKVATPADYRLVSKITGISSEEMAQPFIDLIDSTKLDL